MNAFECYQKYVALKLHFNSDSYDFFKYGGRVRAKESSFNTRRDKYFFQKLASRYASSDIIDLFVSNFLDNKSLWIGDVMSEKCEKIYLKWLKRKESLTYLFDADIDFLLEYMDLNDVGFNALFRPINGHHPPLLKMVLFKEVGLETFIILNEILGFFPNWDNDIMDEIVWGDLKKKCEKYRPFLGDLDLDKFKNILSKKVLE